ncbi:MAG: hypothetical protein AAGC63_12580, partial [Propionicimonas sp.]|nr:hypothetical protein [Propionicimonas sp.]
MAGDLVHPAPLLLAAGLLQVWGDPAAVAPEELAAQLADLLDGQALWDPHQDQPWLRSEALAAGRIQLPRWRPPDPVLVERHGNAILEAWTAAVDRFAADMVRIQAGNPDDLAAARALGPLAGQVLAVSLPARGGRFTWQVPPRIWVAGPRAEAWREVVRDSGWYELDEAAPDLLVIDAGPGLDPSGLP